MRVSWKILVSSKFGLVSRIQLPELEWRRRKYSRHLEFNRRINGFYCRPTMETRIFFARVHAIAHAIREWFEMLLMEILLRSLIALWMDKRVGFWPDRCIEACLYFLPSTTSVYENCKWISRIILHSRTTYCRRILTWMEYIVIFSICGRISVKSNEKQKLWCLFESFICRKTL